MGMLARSSSAPPPAEIGPGRDQRWLHAYAGLAAATPHLDARVEFDLPGSNIYLAHFEALEPSQVVLHDDHAYWIGICLTPRHPEDRGCFVRRWGANRFAPLGAITVVPPRETLLVRSSGGRRTALFCRLEAGAVEQWLPRSFDWTDRRLEASLDVTCPTVRELLQRLAREADTPKVGGERLAEAITTQIAIEFARHLIAVNEPTETGGLASWRLRTIDRRLAEAGAPPTLGELAELCGMSVRHLTRAFRVNRGCSIGDYMEQVRIENAKRLLAGGDSIKVVATRAGFATQSAFSHAFRSVTGVTPRQYRTRAAIIRDFHRHHEQAIGLTEED